MPGNECHFIPEMTTETYLGSQRFSLPYQAQSGNWHQVKPCIIFIFIFLTKCNVAHIVPWASLQTFHTSSWHILICCILSSNLCSHYDRATCKLEEIQMDLSWHRQGFVIFQPVWSQCIIMHIQGSGEVGQQEKLSARVINLQDPFIRSSPHDDPWFTIYY